MSISSVLFLSCNRICSASASRFFCRNWSLSASNARFLSRNSSPSSLEAFRRSSNSVSTSDRVLCRGRVWFAGSSGTPHDFRYSVASPTFFNHSSFCSMPRLINNFQSNPRLSIYRTDAASPTQSPRDRPGFIQDNNNQIETTRTKSRQQSIKSFECSTSCSLFINCINYQPPQPFSFESYLSNSVFCPLLPQLKARKSSPPIVSFILWASSSEFTKHTLQNTVIRSTKRTIAPNARPLCTISSCNALSFSINPLSDSVADLYQSKWHRITLHCSSTVRPPIIVSNLFSILILITIKIS